MFFRNPAKEKMPTQQQVLPGREDAILITNEHAVLKTPLQPPYPNGNEQIVLGLGCFWGAEKAFWQLPGVYTTAVGYSAGFTPNPTYEEVCSGLTGHNEVVLVVFDPQVVAVEQILQSFWQSHNPTQGMRQGGDRGTQYRSGIYCFNGHQQQLAEQTKNQYQATIARQMGDKGPSITTEITSAGVFYFAEDYHQQYLAKNPNGYCGLGGMGIDF